jgi:hypothetical protein
MVGVERERHDTGVVDDDVDGAEAVADLIGERTHRHEVGDVDRPRHDLFSFEIGVRVTLDVAGPDSGSHRRGLLGQQSAESTGGAGDDDGLAGDVVAG